jgi:hypothetical protein
MRLAALVVGAMTLIRRFFWAAINIIMSLIVQMVSRWAYRSRRKS